MDIREPARPVCRNIFGVILSISTPNIDNTCQLVKYFFKLFSTIFEDRVGFGGSGNNIYRRDKLIGKKGF